MLRRDDPWQLSVLIEKRKIMVSVQNACQE